MRLVEATERNFAAIPGLVVFCIALASSLGAAAGVGPQPAQISGQIVEAGSGTPIEGAVAVITTSNPQETFVSDPTDVTGAFSLEVPMGASDTERAILLEAGSPTHAPARLNGSPQRPCFFGCGGLDGQFEVDAGEIIDDIEIQLEPGGVISGTITESASGAGLADAHIQLIHESEMSPMIRWSEHFRPQADASGDYQTSLALPVGEFFVLAVPPAGANFVTQAWQGYACQLAEVTGGINNGCPILATDTVSVTANQITSGIDFALNPGATLAGTLGPTDISRQVWLFNGAGQSLQFVAIGPGQDQWSFTGLAGGSYYLQIGPFGGEEPYLRVLHNGLPCPFGGCDRARGAPLSVFPGSTVSGLSFTLEIGGALKGTLVDADTGNVPPFEAGYWPEAPIARLDIIDADGQVVGGADVVEDEGELTFESNLGIPEGDYFVRTYMEFFGRGVGYLGLATSDGAVPGYADAVYNGQVCAGLDCDLSAATAVSFTPGETSEITLEIATGSSISGSVVDDSNDEPIQYTVVKLVDSANRLLAANYTNDDGEFSFGAFPAGDYYLRTAMSSQLGAGTLLRGHTYFDRVHGAAGNCSENLCDPTAGDVIALDGDNDAGPFELRVQPGPVISGRIIDQMTGDIINGGRVEVYDENDDLVGSYRVIPTDARFQTTALAPGTYTLVPIVSPAYQPGTQTASGAARGTSSGGFSVTIGSESVEADVNVVDIALDVIFRTDFQEVN